MKGIIVVLLGFLSVAWGQTTNVQTCTMQGNASHLPVNANINGCTNPPCLVPQLESLTINIHFRSPRVIRTLVTAAHVYILGPIGMVYDLGPATQTCNFLINTYCPVLENEIVNYKLGMFIESWMTAGTTATVEFVIRDNSDRSVVMCIRLPIRVVPPTDARAATETEPSLHAQRINSTGPLYTLLLSKDADE